LPLQPQPKLDAELIVRQHPFDLRRQLDWLQIEGHCFAAFAFQDEPGGFALDPAQVALDRIWCCRSAGLAGRQ
jgi:hypothetical protein